MTDAPGASDVTVNTRYAMKRYRTGYNTGHAEGYQAGYLEGIKVNSAQTAELNARVADTTVQLSNQYQRIERFVELVDQLERKLAEATEANTSCTLYIASQMERIAELEAQLAAARPSSEVSDTITRSLVSSESINDTYTWMRRVDAATKWINVLRGKE